MHVRILSAVVLLAAHALAAGEPAEPAAPAASEPTFVCELQAEVFLLDDEGERTPLGTTPTLDWRGLRIPAGKRVGLNFKIDHLLTQEVHIRKIAEIANASGIGWLDLRRLDTRRPECWAVLKDVKHLHGLAVYELSDITARELERLPELAELECIPLSNAALETIVARAPKLERLVLGDAEFNSDGLACLKKLPALRHLRILDRNLNAAGVAHLAGIQSLRCLELDASKLDGSAMAHLKDAQLSNFQCAQIEWPDSKGGTSHILNAPVLDAKGLHDFFHPMSAVTEERAEEINALILALDQEDFTGREAATDELLALKLETRPWLQARMQELSGTLSLEQASRLRGVLNALDDRARNGDARRVATELDAAVKETPAHYLPLSPALCRKLKRRIKFEIRNASVSTIQEVLGSKLGAPIVLDPVITELPASNRGICSSGFTVESALEWAAKACDLEAVPRGDAVIFTSSERAKALRLKEVFYDLPSGKGEAPWTDQEAAWFCSILASRTPASAGRLVPWNMGPLLLESCERTKDGRLRVVADASTQPTIALALKEFANPPYQEPPVMPEWLKKIEQALDKSTEVMGLSNIAVYEAFQKASGLQLDPEGENQYSGENISIKGTWRSALQRTADIDKSVLLPENGRLIRAQARVFGGLPAVRRVFDVRPVLAAGVEPKDLAAAVKALFAPLGLDPTLEPFPLRGRFIAAVDPWTEQRVFAVLKAAAESGKIPPLPPEPWFFKTLKYVPAAEGDDFAK